VEAAWDRYIRRPRAKYPHPREVEAVDQGPGASARGAPLLPLRHRRRAAALRPVVRKDGAARQARPRGSARRNDSDFAGALGSGLHQLAGEYSRLEHLTSAMVGSSRPGMVLRQMRL